MLYRIHIDESNSKAKALLEYLKTLDFITVDKDELPSWQEEELNNALKDHKEGNVNYNDWEKVKENLFKKYKIK
jgi:hypothetical protein